MAYYENSFQRTTPVVLNLIIINTLVFMAQYFFDGPEGKITSMLAIWSWNSGLFEPYQVVTSMFAHSDFWHLLFNMFGLWVFGVMLERIWGAKRFLIFYLICGLAASISSIFLINAYSMGASGAVMGLVGGFAYLFPNTPFVIFPVPFPVKAKYLAVVVAAMNFIGIFRPGEGEENIGYLAHLVGLAVGLIIVIIWNKTNKRTFY